ncbi:MAG: hypothetical protein MHM6MM_007491 [Cercozoa sp. M6MM]
MLLSRLFLQGSGHFRLASRSQLLHKRLTMTEINVNLLVHVLNLSVAVTTVMGGIWMFGGNFESVVLGVYVIIFGVMIALSSFMVPGFLAAIMSYMRSFFGRGLFFVFCGTIIMPEPSEFEGAKAFFSLWDIIIGGIFIVLQFVVSEGPPRPLKSDDTSDPYAAGDDMAQGED